MAALPGWTGRASPTSPPERDRSLPGMAIVVVTHIDKLTEN